jgi:hypothetical protein
MFAFHTHSLTTAGDHGLTAVLGASYDSCYVSRPGKSTTRASIYAHFGRFRKNQNEHL